MNVKQGLKRKGKIINELRELYRRLDSANSYREDSVKYFSSRELLQEIEKLTNELVNLKTSIHRANLPVYDKIFRLSELKNHLLKVSSMSTHEGTQTVGYANDKVEYKIIAEINVLELNEIKKGIEEEIDKLQEELDYHNATTLI